MMNRKSTIDDAAEIGANISVKSAKRRFFACTLCPSAFGSKMELEEHVNSHTGRKPFACTDCHTRFNRRSTLWNHKRIHSDHKPFQCPLCKVEFKWKNSLKCHRDMHLRNKDCNTTEFDVKLVDDVSFKGGRKKKVEEECKPKVIKPRSVYRKGTSKRGRPRKSHVLKEELPVPDEKNVENEGDENECPSKSLFAVRVYQPAPPSCCVKLPTICLPDDNFEIIDDIEEYLRQKTQEGEMFVYVGSTEKEGEILDIFEEFVDCGQFQSSVVAPLEVEEESCGRFQITEEVSARVVPVDEW